MAKVYLPENSRPWPSNASWWVRRGEELGVYNYLMNLFQKQLVSILHSTGQILSWPPYAQLLWNLTLSGSGTWNLLLTNGMWQRLGWLCVFVCVSHSVVSNSLQPHWTVAHQGPLSLGFSRQEYWSGLPFPSPNRVTIQGSNSCLARTCGSPFLALKKQSAMKTEGLRWGSCGKKLPVASFSWKQSSTKSQQEILDICP